MVNFFSPNAWQMMPFLKPLDALIQKVPFSFFAAFWVPVTSRARGSVSVGFGKWRVWALRVGRLIAGCEGGGPDRHHVELAISAEVRAQQRGSMRLCGRKSNLHSGPKQAIAYGPGGGGVGTRTWWLALLACGGAYWPLALEPSAMTIRTAAGIRLPGGESRMQLLPMAPSPDGLDWGGGGGRRSF